MNIIEIISLFGIMTVLAALPSASVALVITRSATLGLANGIAVTVGIILGDLVFIFLAIFGLSVVAEIMGSLFIIVKYIGGAYLILLGYKLLIFKSAARIIVDEKIKSKNLAASFLAGFILTLGDVKAIVFYVSLLPLFIDLTALQKTDVFIVISVMIASLGSVKILYALSANKVAGFLKGKGLDSFTRKAAGSFLLGAGGYLIVKS